MQIEHLRYFQSVVECGSMNKAAQLLYCTQPAITNGIRSLETELGRPLLDRTVKGVQPTPYGKAILQDVRLILGYTDRWKRLAEDNSFEQPVIITMTGTAPRYDLVRYILQIKHSQPNIDVQLRQAPPMRGHFDFTKDSLFRIGISYRVPPHMSTTLQYAREHGLQLALLQRDEFRLFMNCEHPLASKPEDIILTDLYNRSVMLYQEPKRFPYVDKLNRVNCRIGTQMWHEDNLMLALALDQNAIAFRPGRLAEHNQYIDDGKVVVRSVIDCPMPVNLCLMFPVTDRLTGSETAFLNSFKGFFPEYTVL